MLAEAEGFGADGVVGVTLSEKHGKGEVREFVVSGTAVRSNGPTHLASPFTTALSGGDVAKLMRAGWMPASIVLGLSVAISELVHAARENARRQLASRTAAIGADGAVLTSQVTLSIEERRISQGHHDVVATARATATAIVAFASGGSQSTASTSVIPMKP
jgi:uncharacterized protein YbjQ (UPF0145 family)